MKKRLWLLFSLLSTPVLAQRVTPGEQLGLLASWLAVVFQKAAEFPLITARIVFFAIVVFVVYEVLSHLHLRKGSSLIVSVALGVLVIAFFPPALLLMIGSLWMALVALFLISLVIIPLYVLTEQHKGLRVVVFVVLILIFGWLYGALPEIADVVASNYQRAGVQAGITGQQMSQGVHSIRNSVTYVQLLLMVGIVVMGIFSMVAGRRIGLFFWFGRSGVDTGKVGRDVSAANGAVSDASSSANDLAKSVTAASAGIDAVDRAADQLAASSAAEEQVIASVEDDLKKSVQLSDENKQKIRQWIEMNIKVIAWCKNQIAWFSQMISDINGKNSELSEKFSKAKTSVGTEKNTFKGLSNVIDEGKRTLIARSQFTTEFESLNRQHQQLLLSFNQFTPFFETIDTSRVDLRPVISRFDGIMNELSGEVKLRENGNTFYEKILVDDNSAQSITDLLKIQDELKKNEEQLSKLVEIAKTTEDPVKKINRAFSEIDTLQRELSGKVTEFSNHLSDVMANATIEKSEFEQLNVLLKLVKQERSSVDFILKELYQEEKTFVAKYSLANWSDTRSRMECKVPLRRLVVVVGVAKKINLLKRVQNSIQHIEKSKFIKNSQSQLNGLLTGMLLTLTEVYRKLGAFERQLSILLELIDDPADKDSFDKLWKKMFETVLASVKENHTRMMIELKFQ